MNTNDDTWSNVWVCFASCNLRLRKTEILFYGVNDAEHSFVNLRNGSQFVVRETVDEIDVLLDRSVSKGNL